MIIVGIGHVARSGKDTAAEALVRDLGFRRFGFADQLKELALEADPMVSSALRTVNVGVGHGKLRHVVSGMTWEGAKDLYPEARTFLENLGRGARKVFGDDFWIDRLLERIERSGADRIVIPDVRHVNEAELIQGRGGIVVRVDRPEVKADPLTRPSEAHLLEWDGWDHVIVNDSDVLTLQRRIVELVEAELKEAA